MKYRLFYLMIICVLLFTVDGLGQNTWVKILGGDQRDEGWSIVPTSDGGCVLTGMTESKDGDFSGMNNGEKTSENICVVKIDKLGQIVWKKIIGGFSLDIGFSITTTTDDGFVLTGQTGSNNGDFVGMNKGDNDIFVMKLNSNGDLLWKRTYGGIFTERGISLTTTKDDEYILTGYTLSNDGDFSGMNKGIVNIYVLKINSNGNIVWKKTFGGSDSDEGNSVTPTLDGGYILTGNTYSDDGDFSGMNKGSYDIFVIKLTSSGDIVWKKTFGGSDRDEGISIIVTSDGGYVLTGWTSSNDGDFIGMNKGQRNIYVMKLNSSGDILWKKIIGGSSLDYGIHTNQTSDGGYVLTGGFSSNDGDFGGMNKGDMDIYVLKLNLDGHIIWKKTFGGIFYDIGKSITTTTNGGFVLTGQTFSNDGDFSGLNKGGSDIFVMKLDSNGNLNNTTSINEFSEPTTTLSVHPNPFSNSTTISYKVNTPSNVRIELLNTLGQTIEVLREDYTDIGTYQLPLNVSTLSSGMYSVRIRSGSMNEVVPVWVVR